MQVTKDYRLARGSGPLTYNDITSASSEGRRDIWTERERDWDEAEAIDTGQTRTPVQDLICADERVRVHSHSKSNIYYYSINTKIIEILLMY